MGTVCLQLEYPFLVGKMHHLFLFWIHLFGIKHSEVAGRGFSHYFVFRLKLVSRFMNIGRCCLSGFPAGLELLLPLRRNYCNQVVIIGIGVLSELPWVGVDQPWRRLWYADS